MAERMVLHRIFNYIYVLVIILSICFTSNYLKLLHEKNLVYQKAKEEKEVIEISKNDEKKYDLDYFRNYYSNNDIIGSIKIDGTKINNLIVKTTNNKYYLNHSLKKEYDERGSIFLDCRTDLNSMQINIYGHNSNIYDLPFKELEKYLHQDFYNSHKYVEIWNGEEIIYYEIFSVQIVTNDYEHMNLFPSNLESHLNKMNESIYHTGIKTTKEDQILVLQTCGYNPKNSLIVVNSKKVKEGK